MPTKTLKDILSMGAAALQPSAFYKAWHPELFSDSKDAPASVLPADLFVFHLDQLTTAKKETEFEDFSRRLAEREICPNLLPQTGPVGGGDSQTDSATYPVAPELSERRWWAGHTQPTDEDWAFAFSCKRDWRTKIKSDVAKIAKLPRRYARVYFVTNQAVKDKARAEVEAALRTEHKLDVRILDRTWIVERVMTNHYEDLAIESLGLQLGQQTERKLGPNDYARTQELSSMLARLRQPEQALLDDYVLAQDYLRAAKLSSSLERPREEVDGLFLRARELAIKCHHLGAIVRTHYTHAWRTHFWYDDPAGTERILDLMFPYLPEVTDAELLEFFSNLCSVLETADSTGLYPCSLAILDDRRMRIAERLKILIADKARPNNALYAETLLASSGVLKYLTDQKVAEAQFKKLRKLFRQAQGLGTYPIFHFMEVWQGLGEHLCDWPGYAELQAEMQQITSARFGEAAAGEQQIKFGWQLLEKGKSAEALVQLSAGRFLLAKEETFHESVTAALGCAAAYHNLGHLWASRMETLVAGHASLGSMENFDAHPRRGYFIAKRMAWIELELGRVAPFLAWRNLAHILLRQLEARNEDTKALIEDLEQQDGCFACLLLKAPPKDVRALRKLAGTLETMGLIMARMALLYVCGEDKILQSETPDDFKSDPEATKRVIESWKSEPAFEQTCGRLSGETNLASTFDISFLGMTYTVSCRNAFAPTLIAESVLGMIDAAFALAQLENFAIIYEHGSIFIDEAVGGVTPPPVDALRKNPIEELKQVWAPDVIKWIYDHREHFSNYLASLLMTLLVSVTIDPWDDLKQELEEWRKSGVFERAFLGTESSMALLDIIGKNLYDIEYWFNTSDEASPPSEV